MSGEENLGNEWSQSVWTANSKNTWAGLPKPIGTLVMTPHPLGTRTMGFNVCPAEFQSVLVPSFLVILLILSFEMGAFTLCHCILLC
jgi:hypothetical protein